MHKSLFTKKQNLYFRENANGKTAQELTELMNARFDMALKDFQTRAYKKNHKIRSGLDCTFKVGEVPFNKGMKLPGNGKGTWFPEGHRPHNWVPVGTERVNTDDYVDIKIAEGKKHKNWRAKHILVWEKNNGSLPKGHAVIFGDGDRKNFDINNLILVTRKQLLTLNRNGLIANNADLTRSAVLVADLISKIIEKKR